MNGRHSVIASLTFATLALAISGFIANPVCAQDMDVDQADSLNFQSFHKNKKEAVKAWEKPAETTKAYDEKSSTLKSDKTTSVSPAAASTALHTVNPDEIKGKRFEMRERYTLTRSTQTPYSAFYVIEPLYKQAAQLCAKGWRKISERSEPIEQDFYLYFEIECL